MLNGLSCGLITRIYSVYLLPFGKQFLCLPLQCTFRFLVVAGVSIIVRFAHVEFNLN